MKIPMLSFDCLQVPPYQLGYIQDLKIVHKINDYARLSLTAVLFSTVLVRRTMNINIEPNGIINFLNKGIEK